MIDAYLPLLVAALGGFVIGYALGIIAARWSP